MASLAQQVADKILADAKSGSSGWVALNGAGAVETQDILVPDRWFVTIPQPSGPDCLITVEMAKAIDPRKPQPAAPPVPLP